MWKAHPKNDRLKRWCILDMESPGTGKRVIADNIRRESEAVEITESHNMTKLEKFYIELRESLRRESELAKAQQRQEDYRALIGAARLAQSIFVHYYEKGK